MTKRNLPYYKLTLSDEVEMAIPECDAQNLPAGSDKVEIGSIVSHNPEDPIGVATPRIHLHLDF